MCKNSFDVYQTHKLFWFVAKAYILIMVTF